LFPSDNATGHRCFRPTTPPGHRCFRPTRHPGIVVFIRQGTRASLFSSDKAPGHRCFRPTRHPVIVIFENNDDRWCCRVAQRSGVALLDGAMVRCDVVDAHARPGDSDAKPKLRIPRRRFNRSNQRGRKRRIPRTSNAETPLAFNGCPTATPVHAARAVTAFARSAGSRSAMTAPWFVPAA
jgi:hypothetical protein